jgi:hypothetical protein
MITIRHINNLPQEAQQYTSPIYDQLDGVYGHIVIDMLNRVWFIEASEQSSARDVTGQYIIKSYR